MKKPSATTIIATLGVLVAVIVFVIGQMTGPKLNILNWDFYIGETTLDTFKSEHSADINYAMYESNEAARDRILQSPGVYDVVFPSDYMMTFLSREGLLGSIDLSKIPNTTNVDSDAIDEFRQKGWLNSCVPYLSGSTGFAIDQSKVEQNPESISWEFLRADAQSARKYRNRVVILDDARQVLGSVLMELGHDPNTTNDAALDDAVSLLRDLRPNILEFSADTGKARMEAGEVDIAFAWSGDSLQVAAEKPNWTYVVPATGGLKFQDGICIPADAPNSDLAHAFINHLLKTDVHVDILETTKYLTTNTVAFKELNGPVKQALESASRPGVRMEYVQSLSDENEQRFQRAWERVKE